MGTLKLTTWNIEWLDKLMRTLDDPGASSQTRQNALMRAAAIQQEIEEIDADILCMVEGPNGEDKITRFCADHLNNDYVPVLRSGDPYRQNGRQWIWFLVKPALADKVSLLPVETWRTYADNVAPEGEGGKKWPVHYWGALDTARHGHYRHPQVLVLDHDGTRVEFIGLHLKSKFVRTGRFHGTPSQKQDYVEEAIKARIKLATEALDVRRYIEHRFLQEEDPAIFVLGDLNDGPGKELFERQFLFFDLLSNIQGDVFFARKFLNHALFDYRQELRWSVHFKDKIDPNRDPHILLDHILFTQGLVNDSLPLQVESGAGLIEHEIHDRINSTLNSKQETGDHKPVSVLITTQD